MLPEIQTPFVSTYFSMSCSNVHK